VAMWDEVVVCSINLFYLFKKKTYFQMGVDEEFVEFIAANSSIHIKLSSFCLCGDSCTCTLLDLFHSFVEER
jgi:hypothetical protein